MDYQFKVNTPYPELKGKENNSFYVSLLKNLYAGKNSELTAILQYIYQAHYFEPINAETADAILKISLVEMEHLELLANAIIFFGGDPKYVSSKDMFFSAKAVDYSKEYTEMLIADMEGEKAAIQAYGDTASIVKNDSLKRLLLRIRYEEELHYAIFERLLTNAIF
ncbi:MAG: ferritin-like domain-containing protein [Clostridia bacterium]